MRADEATLAALAADPERAIRWDQVDEKLPAYSGAEISAAAGRLKAAGKVILGQETDGRPDDLTYSFIAANW